MLLTCFIRTGAMLLLLVFGNEAMLLLLLFGTGTMLLLLLFVGTGAMLLSTLIGTGAMLLLLLFGRAMLLLLLFKTGASSSCYSSGLGQCSSRALQKWGDAPPQDFLQKFPSRKLVCCCLYCCYPALSSKVWNWLTLLHNPVFKNRLCFSPNLDFCPPRQFSVQVLSTTVLQRWLNQVQACQRLSTTSLVQKQLTKQKRLCITSMPFQPLIVCNSSYHSATTIPIFTWFRPVMPTRHFPIPQGL